MHDILKSVLLGVVEGITEFLPVSSTGHMRLVEAWTGHLISEEFTKTFDVFIQLGAIMAVVVFFRLKLLALFGKGKHGTGPEALYTPAQRKHTLLMLGLATLPLAPGFIPAKLSDHYFEKHPAQEPMAIALALGIGGIIMIGVELWRKRASSSATTTSIEQITPFQAILTGCAQILAAVFPGTSRSTATIMTSMCTGMDRATAAEFSFFMAIPAMFAAAGYKLLKFLKSGGADLYQSLLLGIGFLVAFIVAYLVIAAFMKVIRKYTFVGFGIYRIILAAIVLWVVR